MACDCCGMTEGGTTAGACGHNLCSGCSGSTCCHCHAAICPVCVTTECARCDSLHCCMPCPTAAAAAKYSEAAAAREREQAARRAEQALKRRAEEEIALQAKQRAALVVGKKVRITVAAYSPALATLYDKSVPARTLALGAQVESASKRGADVFLAPEYFFNCTDDGKITASSLSDMGQILTSVCSMSRAFPKMLIVPGTIVWANTQGWCRNTTLIYLGGSIQKICHKAGIGYERQFITLTGGKGWVEGYRGYCAFSLGSLKGILEICRDSGTAESRGIFPALRLVVASALGLDGGRGGAIKGGAVVHVDGAGYSQIAIQGEPVSHQIQDITYADLDIVEGHVVADEDPW